MLGVTAKDKLAPLSISFWPDPLIVSSSPQAFLAVQVQVSIQIVSPGCLQLVLGSLGCDPQQVIHNLTTGSLRFKEARALR